jgi:hypothetical protein
MLALAGFTANQVQALADRSFTPQDWSIVFDEITSDSPPEWFPVPLTVDPQVEMHNATVQPLSILSPTAGPVNLFDFQPVLSFDSSDSSTVSPNVENRNLWKSQVVPPELMTHVKQVSSNLKKIKAAWSKPFRDIEAGYKLVVADLTVMNDNMKTMHSRLGDPLSQGQTVWEALDHLHQAYGELEATTEDLEDRVVTTINDHFSSLGLPRDFSSLVDEMKRSQRQLDARLVQMEDLLRVHANRFNNIRPVLERISTLTSPSTAPGSDSLITDLSSRLEII